MLNFRQSSKWKRITQRPRTRWNSLKPLHTPWSRERGTLAEWEKPTWACKKKNAFHRSYQIGEDTRLAKGQHSCRDIAPIHCPTSRVNKLFGKVNLWWGTELVSKLLDHSLLTTEKTYKSFFCSIWPFSPELVGKDCRNRNGLLTVGVWKLDELHQPWHPDDGNGR